MSSTMLTFLGVLILASCSIVAFTKKFPTWLPFCFIPVVIALLVGFQPGDVSEWINDNVKSASGNVMICMFAVMFFGLLNAVGVFDVILHWLLSLTKGNIYTIYIICILMGMIAQLSGSSLVSFTICIPALRPLFDKLKLPRLKLVLLVSLGIAIMNYLPWGTPNTLAIYSPSMEPAQMTRHLLPVMIFGLGMVFALALAFAHADYRKNKAYIDSVKEDLIAEHSFAIDWSDKPYARPKRFVLNLILFIGILASCIILSSVKTYIIFAIGTVLVILVNYNKKDAGKILEENYNDIASTSLLLFSIAIMVGIVKNSGMIDNMAMGIIAIVPSKLLRFFPAIWGWARPTLDCFVPYQAWTAIPPLLVSVGEQIGLTNYQVLATQVIACWGQPCSPLLAPNIIACRLADIEIMDAFKHCWKYVVVLDALAMVFALICGII